MRLPREEEEEVVSKHDRARKEKDARNAEYATRYRQRRCEKCDHRSSKRGPCRECGGKMKGR